jgi:hypothetical protein
MMRTGHVGKAHQHDAYWACVKGTSACAATVERLQPWAHLHPVWLPVGRVHDLWRGMEHSANAVSNKVSHNRQLVSLGYVSAGSANGADGHTRAAHLCGGWWWGSERILSQQQPDLLPATRIPDTHWPLRCAHMARGRGVHGTLCTLMPACSASVVASTSRRALGRGAPTKKFRDVSPW